MLYVYQGLIIRVVVECSSDKVERIVRRLGVITPWRVLRRIHVGELIVSRMGW